MCGEPVWDVQSTRYRHEKYMRMYPTKKTRHRQDMKNRIQEESFEIECRRYGAGTCAIHEYTYTHTHIHKNIPNGNTGLSRLSADSTGRKDTAFHTYIYIYTYTYTHIHIHRCINAYQMVIWASRG